MTTAATPSLRRPFGEARHLAGLLARLVRAQVRSQTQFRVSFTMDVVTSFIVFAFEFGALAALFVRFRTLGGWSLGEVAFMGGLAAMSFKTMDMLFSGFDPPDFGDAVRKGTFDAILLRPAPLTLQVLGSRFVFHRLGAIAEGMAVFALANWLVDVRWTAAKLAFMPVVFVGQMAFFAALFIAGSTVTFWTIDSIEAVNILTYGGHELNQYPAHIYPLPLRRFFTYVVPTLFLNYYPALYLLDKPDPTGMPPWARFIGPAIGVAAFVGANALWRVGIRHYRSTGT